MRVQGSQFFILQIQEMLVRKFHQLLNYNRVYHNRIEAKKPHKDLGRATSVHI